MIKGQDSEQGWRAWLTPAILVAIAAGGFTYLESRFASIDRRFDTLAAEVSGVRTRTDTVVDSQAAMKSELTIVSDRVNRIAVKLDVASVPSESLAVDSLKYVDPVKALRGAGYKVESAEDFLKRMPSNQVRAITAGAGSRELYILDAKRGASKSE